MRKPSHIIDISMALENPQRLSGLTNVSYPDNCSFFTSPKERVAIKVLKLRLQRQLAPPLDSIGQVAWDSAE